MKPLTRGHSETCEAIHPMQDAEGHWVELADEHPLVRSRQIRHYWTHKLPLRLDITYDSETGSNYGRLVRR